MTDPHHEDDIERGDDATDDVADADVADDVVDDVGDSPPKPKIQRDTLDTVLSAVMWSLVVAVLVVGGWFGYSVYVVRQSEAAATPALRLVQELSVTVKERPNDAALRIRLGEALGAAGRYKEAIEQFENALRLEPDNAGAYLDLGLVAMLSEDYGAARRYLLRVVELTGDALYSGLDDRRELAFYNLGLLSLEDKEYEDAIGYFKAALRIRRDASDTYYHLALAFQALDEPDAAHQQLEIALSFDPNYAQAHFLMGELYLADGDEVNASYHFYRAAEIAPEADPPQEALASFGTPDERIARGEDLLSGGDVEAALLQALVARNLAPDSAQAAAFHGLVLIERTDYADAVEVLEEALKLAGDDDAAIEAELERARGLAGEEEASTEDSQ